MASLGCSESYFPEEMALQCLTWVPGAHAHFVISTCCRSFRAVSKDDSLWIGRLRRDFPRCRAQDKAPGRLHITYKILAKSYQSQFSRSKERFGRWQQSSPESQSVKQERSESWWQLMASRPVSKALQPGADVQIQRWRVFVSALARRACDSSFGVSGQYSIAVCDGCGQWCIAGQHYKCAICPDYDLCGACYRRRHELHVAHDEWNRTETGSSSSIAIPQVAEQTRPWVLHASSGMVLTREEVQHHVRRLNASRREEPTQVAAALEAQGCGVSRTIDMFERSLAPIDLPACTFESIGTSTWSSHRQPAKPRLSHAVIPNECTKLNHGSKHMCKEDQCVSLQVIESVAHDEQAAQIDEQEAAEFTALQHADFIERNLGWTSIESAAEVDAAEINCANDASEEQDIVIVGKLNRMSKALQDELNRGAPLRACRDALEEAGHPLEIAFWNNGIRSSLAISCSDFDFESARAASLSHCFLRVFEVFARGDIGSLQRLLDVSLYSGAGANDQ
eukprot:CAMPEP_0169120972 /NCGR_PEP_ID=MMETSP1015-20121227/32403_1 /TAXON_ID=342587 /ORGANISM="Karlodinium micrum, Strain CCMP2283" /LENGTH=507 /DNA_ID=CAMNT_0009184011 /DNA_START=48 /DNA_END=1570 /DNA_ORIENTATION=-